MTTSPSVLPSFKLVEIAFSSAIRIVDKQYGKGYALKNPQLIASLSQIILDNSSTDSGVSPFPKKEESVSVEVITEPASSNDLSPEEVQEFFGALK